MLTIVANTTKNNKVAAKNGVQFYVNKKLIHVAAAVIEDGLGNILLAKRPDDKHQGGLWEFPGGKVEEGESPQSALFRELDEEVDIKVVTSEPLIQIPYHYPDKSVFLDVFRITNFSGKAWGKEGQETRWVPIEQLDTYSFPAANQPILNAALLSKKIFVTPAYNSLSECLQSLNNTVIKHSIDWILFRQKQLSEEDFCKWVTRLQNDSTLHSKRLTLNCSVGLANNLGANSVHLTSDRLMALSCREEFKGRFLGASCHTQEELNKAVSLKCDYVTLSPIKPTHSHPGAPALGWDVAASMISQAALPVYLLGGMNSNDLSQAQNIGAQGIAAISAWYL